VREFLDSLSVFRRCRAHLNRATHGPSTGMKRAISPVRRTESYFRHPDLLVLMHACDVVSVKLMKTVKS